MAASNADVMEDKGKLTRNRLGLWLFLVSDAFIFGGLMVTRLVMLGGNRPDLSQPLGLAVTVLLLMSSFFMNRAETEMSFGNTKAYLRNVLTTFILGVVFLVGVVGVEWRLAVAHGLTPNSSPEGAVFYVMTGFHAFHVLTGVIFLWVVYQNGRRGVYSAEKHWGVEAAAIYWHFIDVAWIFFYPALYLMGTVAGS